MMRELIGDVLFVLITILFARYLPWREREDDARRERRDRC